MNPDDVTFSLLTYKTPSRDSRKYVEVISVSSLSRYIKDVAVGLKDVLR